MSSEAIIDESRRDRIGQSYVEQSPYLYTVAGFIPLVLITMGVSLSTRSLVQPLDGQRINLGGTLLGILAGMLVLMGSGVAIVACVVVKAAFEKIALSGAQGVDLKALALGLRFGTTILAIFPWPFLLSSVVLGCAALFGFSDGSVDATRRGTKVVILSWVLAFLIAGLFSLHLRDTLSVVKAMAASGDPLGDPSEWANPLGRSLYYEAPMGYGLLAFQGVVIGLAALLGPRQQNVETGVVSPDQPPEGVGLENGPIDPDLASVIDGWHSLPSDTRTAILAIVEAAQGRGEGRG